MADALLVDFGSTFTKFAVVDMDTGRLKARTMTPTTPADLTRGLRHGVEKLRRHGVRPERMALKLACSSAAGGLRVVAIGLVSALTAEAARRAALGAGARVVGVFAGLLSPGDVAAVAALRPDMLLLAGGTDGGNWQALVHNAQMLAQPAQAGGLKRVPVVVAGNEDGALRAESCLVAGGFDVRVTTNVMPRLGVLEVEPARAAMRELFLTHIVRAKGLDAVEDFVEGVLLPTPAAVLAGAQLLAHGTAHGPGWGEVAIVDVGGATTDVHSVGAGAPLDGGAVRKGLPEPVVKRTVEGDLGVRAGAAGVVEAWGEAELLSFFDGEAGGLSQMNGEKGLGLTSYVDHVTANPHRLPRSEGERAFDTVLAAGALRAAMARHVGRVQERMTAAGVQRFVTGKDLRAASALIGTGGVLVHGADPARLLRYGVYSADEPDVLLPKAPRLYIDRDYVLAASGLLVQRAPDAAWRLLNNHLVLLEAGRPGR